MNLHFGKTSYPGALEFKTHSFSQGAVKKERFIVHRIALICGLSGKRADGTEWFFGFQKYGVRDTEDRPARSIGKE